MHFIVKLAVLISLGVYPTFALSQEWSFTAFLDGKEIGQHRFTMAETEAATTLTSVANFKVKILFINAYEYKHKANEQWEGDCLTSLDARTQENRDISLVKGKRQNGKFSVVGPKGQLELPACAMTFAYWNPEILTQKKLLNPQTGEWLDVNISNLGQEVIDVRDQKVSAERYRLTAPKMKIDLWYSPDKEWLGLESTTPEGYLITYKLR